MKNSTRATSAAPEATPPNPNMAAITEMTKATAERMKISFEDLLNGAAQTIPVARVGQPEDIAHTASFLVSEGAGFVSGQVIYVAGGPKD